MGVDDSALLHGRNYDPVKAHEYYLRTRQLKGRHRGSGNPPPRATAASPNQAAAARRQRLMQEKAALERRLDHLRDVLAKLVADAKRRSGVETPTKKTAATKKTASASKKSSSTKDKPLTEAQKREKAKKAKEEYDKTHPKVNLSGDIHTLQLQIQDIRAQIQKAIEDARAKSSRPTSQTASNGR